MTDVADSKKSKRFTWTPGDLVWKDRPTSAQKLAGQASVPKRKQEGSK